MITLFINCSLIGLALIALLKNNQDKLSIFSFVAIWAAFGMLSNNIGYPQYYVSGAMTDLIIIIFLSKISKPTKTIITLQKVSKISIYLNLFGFICYFARISHIYYDLLYLPLLFITVYAVNKRDDTHGDSANNIWLVNVLNNNIKSLFYLQKDKKATRN